MAAAMARRERIYEAIASAIWETPTTELHPGQVEEAYRITDLVLAAVLVADNETDDGAATPGLASGGSMPGSMPEASEVAAGTAPSSPFPRRFLLFRHADVSGVSGTGVVAEGAEWTDGTASLRWRGDYPSTVAWDDVELLLGAHGHEGATELRWIDPEPHVGYWPVEGEPE